MRAFLQNKLWRDKIVSDQESTGSKIHWQRLNDVEYDRQLRNKLLEEAHEVCGATSSEALSEELGDVLEVMQSLAAVNGIDWDDVVLVQNKKRQEKGGFVGRKYVSKAQHPPGSAAENYCLRDPVKYPEV